MNTRPACKINDLIYPASDKITSRISTLCRSMACTLMKREACSPQVEKEWMQFFPDKTCAYALSLPVFLLLLFSLSDWSPVIFFLFAEYIYTEPKCFLRGKAYESFRSDVGIGKKI